MSRFCLKTDYKPTGDQPQAIDNLLKGLSAGKQHQVLLGVTGSGKTFTMANVIAGVQRPTLIISHNKTLAAQLFQEFREFFPENAVHYFVSYYDYYQPEAYIPVTDTYIQKDAKINEEIDKLRHATTQAILTRQDVIIIASVSCIYGLGSPQNYQKIALEIAQGEKITQKEIIRNLIDLQYERNQFVVKRGSFQTRGELLYVYPVSAREVIKIEWQKSKIANIEILPFDVKKENFSDYLLRPEASIKTVRAKIFPAKHFILPFDKLSLAISNIKAELASQISNFKSGKKHLETQRIKERTNYDLEMLQETGYCHGIENYSRHLDFREAGQPPSTLIDYFNYAYPCKSVSLSVLNLCQKPGDWLLIIDESHMALPQLRSMYAGDYARKKILIEHGFRLPSALDNRPLKFFEFQNKAVQTIYVSATPGPYELKKATKGKIASVNYRHQKNKNGYLGIEGIVEQLVRPTGLLDPRVKIKPIKGQVRHLIKEIKKEVRKNGRVLVTTLTKSLAEDIADFLKEKKIRVAYLHAEVKTLDRSDVLKNLRKGKIDVIVGINLLREGLDLPEVSLVAILDADKEGFLRNETTLIQTMGRASRHPEGRVIMYADKITGSIKNAILETERRRNIQENYNRIYKITPRQIVKAIRRDIIKREKNVNFTFLQNKGRFDQKTFILALEKEMEKAAQNLEFLKAAKIRDKIKELRKKH